MKFSEREGFKKNHDTFQTETMDIRLKTKIWNTFYEMFFSHDLSNELGSLIVLSSRNPDGLYQLIKNLWDDIFELPISEIPKRLGRAVDTTKKHYEKLMWYEVYDFLQLISNEFKFKSTAGQFRQEINKVLEKEMSAWRFVSNDIGRITDQNEIKTIEEATNNIYSPISEHLKAALCKLSDRKNPDYRNSIKESISSVEAMCRVITGDDKATLGKALNKLKDTIEIHPALEDAYKKIYCYTNDADGIRHASNGFSSAGFDEAKFMLVSCSAFINYLKSKIAS